MKELLWWLLEMVDDNWGYSTPLQKRFKIGEKYKISPLYKTNRNGFAIGEKVTIIETGRRDYLVENSTGLREVVYQYELF
jgi:hypothetical protein